jgi:hypothetical protein
MLLASDNLVAHIKDWAARRRKDGLGPARARPSSTGHSLRRRGTRHPVTLELGRFCAASRFSLGRAIEQPPRASSGYRSSASSAPIRKNLRLRRSHTRCSRGIRSIQACASRCAYCACVCHRSTDARRHLWPLPGARNRGGGFAGFPGRRAAYWYRSASAG